jgi:hypothetical protein
MALGRSCGRRPVKEIGRAFGWPSLKGLGQEFENRRVRGLGQEFGSSPGVGSEIAPWYISSSKFGLHEVRPKLSCANVAPALCSNSIGTCCGSHIG